MNQLPPYQEYPGNIVIKQPFVENYTNIYGFFLKGESSGDAGYN